MFGKIEGAVQRRLPAHGRQQRIGPFLSDNIGDRTPLYRLDIGRIGHRRVGHNGRWIGVDQNHSEALFAKRLTGLGTRVVKLARLTNNDRPSADD